MADNEPMSGYWDQQPPATRDYESAGPEESYPSHTEAKGSSARYRNAYDSERLAPAPSGSYPSYIKVKEKRTYGSNDVKLSDNRYNVAYAPDQYSPVYA